MIEPQRRRILERIKRGGKKNRATPPCAKDILDSFADGKKTYVTSQFLAFRRRFQRDECSYIDEATANKETLDEFEQRWSVEKMKLSMISGKDALSRFNEHIQNEYGITVTSTAIIDTMRKDEIPKEMRSLVELLDRFTTKSFR